ncbi:CFEM domain-containing protein [Purpureocillium lilacinum]|uniref:CFEM domain-containing protein n=1 Tax=Purpureocillium lilacinum TaxID=33203 RepID=A0A179HWJ1_PURLI|nr:CFEM domain-containing protein [Purpureocillium lilacinum]OAQ93921.1 CFEM domain-containing protein [Purpureocillium lilacinum]
MKSTYFIAAFVALAQAKSIDDIPACARDCLRNSVKKVTPQCGESDFHCICPKFDAVRGDAAGCVLGACGAETGKGNPRRCKKALRGRVRRTGHHLSQHERVRLMSCRTNSIRRDCGRRWTPLARAFVRYACNQRKAG